MTQLSSSDVPGMGRRQFMNLLTFGSVTGVALGALYPVVNYFIPPKAAGSGGGTSAPVCVIFCTNSIIIDRRSDRNKRSHTRIRRMG